ncbi:RagB/SusD family nutrient uptake outer membrane protein [Gaoshiqia sediminis]|uniref:RagB/SusD family nutrient uptake outer membrane protein n=1 Tax=Gaoshiqia sediminis TaxID=2986998 RepID=A0AA41Y5Q4_9BACT|nr:RagB/SusD family nutrient uptake outer membrane protein [Gaoshiqia sediminis]MCW0483899.1 RagB/SusD family nutrient uptake outer membrane protein [Gaoshiqia sediminis]
MKKYIILILSIALFGACELDMQPESELTYNGFWESEEAVKAAHTGIYASYRGYAYTIWQMGELRSDIWGGNTIESPFGTDLIDNNISTSIVHFGNWANFYGLLHYINDFIANAPNVTFANEADKNHMLGQVYGIRAQIYYTMVKAWGDVPISTEPLLEVDLEKLKKPRSPKAEVMQQIKSDIAKSLEYFGSDNGLWLNKNVYWSKAATLALKGDVYLWSGKVLGGGTADFTEAKNALSQVTGFSLVEYNKLWGQANENNNEFIFSFDYQQDQADNYYASFTGRAVDFAGLFDDAGNSVASLVVNGASRFGPSDKLLLAMDDANDLRRETFVRLYSDGAVHFPYQAGDATYKGAVLAKFLGIIGDDGSRKNYNNVPLYRYADVLLLLAEAKNNLNEDPSAEINAVRERAYGENFAGNEFTNGTKAENTQAILDERLKEFVGEGKRWWDLVRAGDGIVFDEVATLNASEAYKIYYSISQSMLANDSELTQTEGY